MRKQSLYLGTCHFLPQNRKKKKVIKILHKVTPAFFHYIHPIYLTKIILYNH